MPTLAQEEGVPFQVADDLRAPLRLACGRVQQRLRPRLRMLEETQEGFTIRGVFGTIGVRPGVRLDLSPKVPAGENWIAAILDLLLAPDRIDVAGDRRSGLTRQRSLLDVLADVYAERLSRALRRDGPILAMERRTATLPMLRGKLRTTVWAARERWQPNRFPVAFQELRAGNDFSRTLARVALLLARGTGVPSTRGALLDSARALGHGPHAAEHIRANAPARHLPQQWAAYQPSWDIALSILTRRSLLGAVGARHGVSIAVEGWPLLERLLERSLETAVQIGAGGPRTLSMSAKQPVKLLRARSDGDGIDQAAKPDASLLVRGRHVATLDAKYTQLHPGKCPKPEHTYQVLSAAAACGSPLAVLVYPEEFEPRWWNVEGVGDTPKHLAAIGLGLFGYRRGDGDRVRAKRLLALLDGPAAPAMDVAPAAESVAAR